jgi:hypothetical protein
MDAHLNRIFHLDDALTDAYDIVEYEDALELWKTYGGS